MASETVYTVGGAVPTDRVYVLREADQVLDKLCQSGDFAYVLTSRQLGKSSLRRRIVEKLDAQGIIAIDIDLTAIGTPEDTATWYLGILTTVEDVLLEKNITLETEAREFWAKFAHLGPTQRFTRYFQQVLLTETEARIVVFVDEIDTTLRMPYRSDFFAAIRYFYEARLGQPEFNRLAFVLIGVATPSSLINDAKRTPFNIGQRIDLTDFSLQEALPLASGLKGSEEQRQLTLGWIVEWTGGHPYLTQKLCATLAADGNGAFTQQGVDEQVKKRFIAEGSLGDDNLRWVDDFLTRGAPLGMAQEVLATYRNVRLGRRPVYDEPQSPIMAHLKLSGIVRVVDGQLRVRNRIYEETFDAAWIKEKWPSGWWASIPIGIKIASAISALLFVALLVTAIVAIRQQQQTQRTADALAVEVVARAEAEATAVSALGSAQAERDRAEQEAQRAEQEAQRAEQEAKVAHARQLATLALLSLDEKLDFSLLLAVESFRMQDTAETRNALLAGLETNHHLTQFLHGHQDSLWRAAFSPDGKIIASAGADYTVATWDVSTGQAIHLPLAELTDEVMGLDFGLDSTTLVAVTDDNLISVLDVATGEALREPILLDGAWMHSIAHHPHKPIVAVGGCRLYRDGDWFCGEGAVYLIDLTTGELLFEPLIVPTEVFPVAFSPDGEVIAAGACMELDQVNQGCAQGGVWRWNVESGEPAGEPILGHEHWVWALDFSPDGKKLVTGSPDFSVRLWDMTSGQPIGSPMQSHASWIRSVAFSSDGRTVASASDDHTIVLWDTETGQGIGDPLLGHAQWVVNVAFDAEGKRLVSAGGDNRIIVWDATGGQTLGQELLDRTPVENQVENEPRQPLHGLAFSPDGQTIASAGADHKVKLWSVEERMSYEEALSGHQDEVLVVAYSPDGRILASAGNDKTIILWDSESLQPLHAPLVGHSEAVATLAFSPDGSTLVSSGIDHTLRFWDVATGQALDRVLSHPTWNEKHYIYSVAFSPDGRYLASGGRDMSTILWNLETDQPITPPLVVRPHWMRSIAFSPDGSLLASANQDTTIVLGDVARHQIIGQPLVGHTGAVFSLAFSPDGQMLASGSRDQKVMLWDVATGQPIGLPLEGHKNVVSGVAFSPDGQLLVSSSYDGTLRLWDLDFDHWIARACRIANRNLTAFEWQLLFGDEPYRQTCPDTLAVSALTTE